MYLFFMFYVFKSAKGFGHLFYLYIVVFNFLSQGACSHRPMRWLSQGSERALTGI